MPELVPQFEVACANVEPSDTDKDHASKAHTDVRQTLETDQSLADTGIDTVLIGSYRRQVSIKRVKDVDVFAKMLSADGDATGEETLTRFQSVLSDAYGSSRVERQQRSIKVKFPSYDLHVDAVPARPVGEYWELPDPDDGWKETNPEEMLEITTEMNARRDYKGLYVPTVKLVRQTRRIALGKDRPGGFFFEILAYHAFNNGLPGVNIAQLYVAAIRSISDQLKAVAAGGAVRDPTMEGAIVMVKSTKEQFAMASRRFADIADKAEAALSTTDPCEAARVFRAIFGKNADGEIVFPMPAGCADQKAREKVGALVAGDRTIPAGDRRFA